MYLYSNTNTPSNAIVNIVSKISYNILYITHWAHWLNLPKYLFKHCCKNRFEVHRIQFWENKSITKCAFVVFYVWSDHVVYVVIKYSGETIIFSSVRFTKMIEPFCFTVLVMHNSFDVSGEINTSLFNVYLAKVL